MKLFHFLFLPLVVAATTACGGQQTTEETPISAVPVDSTESTQTASPAVSETTPNPTTGDLDVFVGDQTDDTLSAAVEDAVNRARSGDLDFARTDLQQLLGEPEVEAYALYGLGVIAFYEGQQSSALDYFDQAMVSDPNLVDPLIASIRVNLHDDDVSGARRLLQRQLSASDNSVQVRAAELYITLYEGRYEQVISDGRGMLLEDPANLDIHFAMGMANYYLERYELASYIMQISIERDSERPDFYFLLAMIEQAQGNSAGVETWLNRVVAIDSNHPEALNHLGVLALRSRAWEEAQAYFQNAAAHAPDYREAWLNLGNAYKGMGELEQAQTSFERALSIDPDYADPYFNLGILYLDAEMGGLTRQQRCQRAIDYFADYRSHVGSVSSDDRVVEYAEQAATCVQTELDLLAQEAQAEVEAAEAAAAATEAGTCMDDFGFECFPGDPDCLAPDGSACSDSGGGAPTASCTDDFGFDCSPGDPDCFDALGNTCEASGGTDSDSAADGCVDDFGFDCMAGDPDCFDAAGNVCGGQSDSTPSTSTADGCVDDFGFDCGPGDPDCFDTAGNACGAMTDEAAEAPPTDETPAVSDCYDDFGFACGPGDPECYDTSGELCGAADTTEAPTSCYDDFGFECAPGDPECYDAAGNPCE